MKNIILFILISFLSFHSFAQDSFCESIVVEGKSSVKLVPEQLIFNINMSVKDSNYTKCTNLAIEKIDLIKSQFTKNGIDKDLIKTQNYSIREIRKHDYKTQKSIFEGFEASIPITIKTSRDYNKNDQIFEIIKNNFEANFNLNFALTPEQIEAVKEKLITLAVEDAKQKVNVITKSTEVKLGKISKIQYGEPHTVRPYSNNYDLMKAGSMRAISSESSITETINPDEVEMRTEIMIAWKIEE
jgi:uncharacterized protein YggE